MTAADHHRGALRPKVTVVEYVNFASTACRVAEPAVRLLLESNPDTVELIFRPGFDGRVSDSVEGRWTIQAAIDESVPAPVLSAALHAPFGSRDEAEFSNRPQSATRREFCGHLENPVRDLPGRL
jgi:hypothetical protein